jgi:integration host factor subunit alpha
MATHTITKATLANTLFDQLGLNKREAKEFVDLFFEQIRQALEIGESVKLSGFGGFTIREKNSRPGRNPKTGEEVPVSARRVVTYRASQKVREQISDNTTTISANIGRGQTS